MDFAAITEATWPPAATRRLGPWRLRDGAGGGKRVSAATAEGAWRPEDIPSAEAAMQTPLFLLRAGEEPLDAALEAAGYRLVDPVWVYACATETLAQPLPHASAMTCWPPLAIQAEIWSAGGIGPARRAVMERVTCPKTAILGRTADQAAGTAFVAIAEKTAMIHAIEVGAAFRRQGVARNMMVAAANWAQHQGATEVSLLVTQANQAANALYASLGLKIVGQYHYRMK
jgi:ribosomal protein S18 acetylase RimI-like enzyme